VKTRDHLHDLRHGFEGLAHFDNRKFQAECAARIIDDGARRLFLRHP
jgi:hypothetical protein